MSDQENLREFVAEDDGDLKEGGLVMPEEGQSVEGKLLVKIKFPKMVAEEAEAAGIGDGEEVKKYYCADCDKSFASGKALGGHMSSAHVQANKDSSYSLKKMKFKNKNKQNSWGSQRCSLCGKNFPSKKSLFGHMRSHPERYWRGMDPPSDSEIDDSMASSSKPGAEGNGLYQESDDSGGPDLIASMVGDLAKSLTNWTVTGRRGRRATKPVIDSPTFSTSEKNEVLDAVYQLIRLIRDDSEKFKHGGKSMKMSDGLICQGPETDIQNRASENKNQDTIFPGRKLTIENGDIKNKGDNNKGKGVISEQEKEISANVNSTSDYKNLTCENTVIPGKKRKMDSNAIERTDVKRKKIDYSMTSQEFTKDHHTIKFIPVQEKEESPPSAPEQNSPDKQHICTVCNRTFPTHQALGGHRSSHSKLKISIYNAIDERPVNSTKTVIKNDEQNPNTSSPTKNTTSPAEIPSSFDEDDAHLCNICNKTFPSGQALGGHKRCHWTGAAVDQNPQSPPKIRDFDLNQTPNIPEN